MNRKLSVVGVASLIAIAACAAPEVSSLNGGDGSFGSTKKSGKAGDDDDKPSAAPKANPDTTKPATTDADTSTMGGTLGDGGVTTAPSSSSSASDPPPPSAPPFTLTIPLGKRLGDNDAVANSGTSVKQMATLALIHVPTNSTIFTANGGALDAIRDEIGEHGRMTVQLPGNTQPGLYAVVDAAHYTPGQSVALAPGMDLEHFPKGVVAYASITPPYPNKPATAYQQSDVIWSRYEPIELAMGRAERLKSPLVIDLGGHGLSFAPPRPIFDIDGDGRLDRIAWVASDETPFLVRDRNHNGRIDGVDEMFGDGTLDRNGHGRTSKNGFEALAQHDLDGNGIIDARDPVFRELSLWFDRNHDGITDEGELVPLAARHITQIALDYASVDVRGPFQSRILQKGEAATKTGHVAIYDVWFRLEP